MIQLFAGLFTEGTTDIRFLNPVIEKILIKIAFDCKGDVEVVLKPIEIKKQGLSFMEQVINASEKALEVCGAILLFVHTDADSSDDTNTWESKINPALSKVKMLDKQTYCKDIIPLVPITMTEAWMLADKDLLKKQLGVTNITIPKQIENIANPKQFIENLIKNTQQNRSKRQRGKQMTIADLYQILGESININYLQNLSAYQKFENNIRTKLKELNYLT